MKTDPASEPPTQAIEAGVNAGAFPAFRNARVVGVVGVVAGAFGGGLGLFRMAKCGVSGRRGA